MIQTLHGIKSRTRLYNMLYPLSLSVILVARLVTQNSLPTLNAWGSHVAHFQERISEESARESDINAASVS